MCDTCDDDASNDCVLDCFGNWGGDATLDVCGVCHLPECGDNICSGDETASSCANDCVSGAFASLYQDECGVCFGNNASMDECGICDGSGIVDGDCDCDGNGDVDGDGECDNVDSSPYGEVSLGFGSATESQVTIEYNSTIDIGGYKFQVSGVDLTDQNINKKK